MTRAVLFDLDGTLLDSFALITAAFRAACREVLGREPSAHEVLERWGQPLAMRFAALAPDRVESLVGAYSRVYEAAAAALLRPFPGVPALLDRLADAGLRLAVVTSKRRHAALRDLARCGLLDRFHAVVASEDAPAVKPAPDPVRAALSDLRTEAVRSWMVGDAALDIAAGRAAGTRTIGALWGARDR
ncbi:MAG TPA: HAD-IA family hydrolase, partial [bacterium]|nr:HAD-IA family hydrolase [bacterium]